MPVSNGHSEPVAYEAGILAVIERAVRDPGVDIEKMERLFAVQWEDGAEYAGRFDLQHSSRGWPDIAQHIREQMVWLVTHAKQGIDYYGQEYRAKTMLLEYDVGQGAVLAPDGTEVEIVADYRQKIKEF